MSRITFLKKIISLWLLVFAVCVQQVKAGVNEYCPPGDVLYLASFSLPDTSFLSVFRDAFLHKGRVRVVFRGIPEPGNNGKPIWTLNDVIKKLKPLVDEAARDVRNSGEPAPGKIRLEIDPRPFAKFKVKVVPAFVFCNGTDSPRMVLGDVSLDVARYYLSEFPEKQVIEYGPKYDIKERDIRVALIDLSSKLMKSPDFKEIARRAKKRIFTGWEGPGRAKKYQKREIQLADLMMKAKDDLLPVLDRAMENQAPVGTMWKQVFFLDRKKAEEIARKVALTSAGEEVIMVDARDPAQVSFALKEIKKNPRAVVLMAGPMERYYRNYPLRVFPLRKWQVEKWNIHGLPARLQVKPDGVVEVEEGFLFFKNKKGFGGKR